MVVMAPLKSAAQWACRFESGIRHLISREIGEIGNRNSLRSCRRKASGFESRISYYYYRRCHLEVQVV